MAENVEVPRCATDPSCQPLIESVRLAALIILVCMLTARICLYVALPSSQLAPEHKPTLPLGPDLKWRYFWRIGQRPKETKFQELNVPPVIPKSAWEAGPLGAVH